MPSIFDMILGSSPNVSQVDNSDPTGAYLGNMIDPNTAAQFQSALNQQRMLNFSSALGQASAPQLGKPVTFGGAMSQALGAVANTPDSFVGTTLKAAQTRNQLTDSDMKKLQSAGLLQTMALKNLRVQNLLNQNGPGGQAGDNSAAPGASGASGASGAEQPVGAAQSLLSNAYPAVSSKTADENLPPEARALLDTISGPESKGAYNVRYTPKGGVTFDSYAQHPQIYEPGPQGPSSAAGRYQMVASTWNPIAQKLGLPDFSPQSQDQGAWQLAQTTYQQKTGRDLLGDLQAGNLAQVGDALRGQWATLPHALGGYMKNLTKYADNTNNTASDEQPTNAPQLSGETQAGFPQLQGAADAVQNLRAGGAAPMAAPQAAGPASQQLAAGAAPFTKTNSVGEQYQWNGQGWQLVGNQAPANVQGGTAGAGDTRNGIDRTSGPVTSPIMGLLSNAQQPTQLASNGPLPAGLLASRTPAAPLGIPPGILSGQVPSAAPQASAAPLPRLAQVGPAQAGPGAAPYTYNPAPMTNLPIAPGYNSEAVRRARIDNGLATILGETPDPTNLRLGNYGFDAALAQQKAVAEQKARAEAAFARSGNEQAATLPYSRVPVTVTNPDGSLSKFEMPGDLYQQMIRNQLAGQTTPPQGGPLVGQRLPQGAQNAPGAIQAPMAGPSSPAASGGPAAPQAAPGGMRIGEPMLNPVEQANPYAVYPKTVLKGVPGQDTDLPVPADAAHPYNFVVPAFDKALPIPRSEGQQKVINDSNAEIQKQYQSQLPSLEQGLQQTMVMRDALSAITAGKWTEEKADINAKLKSVGLPQVFDADPGKAAIALKENLNMTYTSLKSAGVQRITNMEVSQGQRANPSLAIQPEADAELLANNLGSIFQQQALIRGTRQAQQQGWVNLSDYQKAFYEQNPLNGKGGFVDQASPIIGDLRGMNANQNSTGQNPAMKQFPNKTETLPTGMPQGAQKAPDGQWYVPLPNGGYGRVVPK